MIGEDKVTEKKDKLKDIQFTLKDKYNRETKMITFLRRMMSVQLVNKKSDKEFKTKKIQQNQTSVNLVDDRVRKTFN